MDYFEQSLKLHEQHKCKLEIRSKFKLESHDDLSVAYTPGEASVCDQIKKKKSKAYDLTIKGNSVAIISDGSAVLGLGDIGHEAALPGVFCVASDAKAVFDAAKNGNVCHE